jgi:hypothetical protein
MLSLCLTLSMVSCLGGCAGASPDVAPSNTADSSAAPSPADSNPNSKAPVQASSPTPSSTTPGTTPEAVANSATDTSPTLEPTPTNESGTGDKLDLSCKSDADCTVKDVGSCCGYHPACVNKDSPTYAEQVKARCASEGRVGICGFQPVDACTCSAGKCSASQSSDSTQVQ